MNFTGIYVKKRLSILLIWWITSIVYNLLQAYTISKSIISYKGHTLRYRYRGQAATVSKCTSRYGLSAGRYRISAAVIGGYIGKHRTAVQKTLDGSTSKSIIPYRSHTLWYRYRGQAATFAKCIPSYKGHTLRYRYRGQAATVSKCTSRYGLSAGRYRISAAVIGGHIGKHRAVVQRALDGSTSKSIISYRSHTLRYRYRGQAATILKSTLPNRCHTLWYRHRDQASIIPKSGRSDRGHTFFYYHF